MITRNEKASRFEAQVGGVLAIADYRIEGDQMIFTHTWVLPEFRGKGIAEKLVLAGFIAAKSEGLKIVPQCSYVVRMLERHPEFQSP